MNAKCFALSDFVLTLSQDEHSQLYGELEELRERLGQWAK